MEKKGIFLSSLRAMLSPFRKSETLTVDQFQRLPESLKARIQTTQIIPAKLGEPGYGKIRIIYRYPVRRLQSAF